MKQSYFTGVTSEKELFPGSDVTRKYTFKTMCLGPWSFASQTVRVCNRDNYALLAMIFPVLSAHFGLLRGKSALFSQTSDQKDCFECLSPHKIAA